MPCSDVFSPFWRVSGSVLVTEFPSLFMRWLCSQQISCRLSLKLHVCFWNWTFYRLSCCLSSDFLSEKPDKVATVPKVCVYHPTLNFHRLENLRKWKWKRKCMFTVDLVRIYNKSWLINTTCYLLSATWLNRDQSQISNISAFSLFALWLSFHSDLNFEVGILN